MHRRALFVTAASAALVACSAPTPRDGQTVALPDATLPATHSADAFDVQIYRAVAVQAGNQFLSPFSVASAFALLYPGAHGQTAVEIATTFGFDASPAVQATRTHLLAQTLTTHAGGSEFTTAEAAWVERTMALRAEYARLIRDQLGATIEAVDFIADQGAALQRINAWAARETHDRIPEILTDRDANRRLVLTNAVYFKGKWRDPFSASATRDGQFFTASGVAQHARLMRQIAHARYFEGEGFQAAEFDYDDGEFGLAVFLPRERAGLEAFEGSLTGAHLDDWLQRLAGGQTARLDVTLPKVQLNANYDLVRQLRAVGLRAAFTDGADFSGVTEQTSLAVSAVIHKTFLAIDEEGTEAAAATAVDMRATAAMAPPPPPPIEFKADHPFFIVLRHKSSRTRLFLGRIATID
jgi:serine protease inhibitor